MPSDASRPLEHIIDSAREKQIEELKRDGDEARAAIAEANARALEAQAALEKYKKPRNLDIDSFLATVKSAPPAKVEVLYVRECSDCSWTAQFIGSFLNTAGWKAVWAAIDEQKAAAGPWRHQPVAVSVRGAPWGITVLANDISESAINTPFGHSVHALQSALFKSYSEVVMTNDPGLPPDLIRVVVAPKP